jgi:glycosyltransferase involved in cell wall biosynthesis
MATPNPIDLSILIPTRNRRDRLLETLDALDRQRLDGAKAELVVVDNGSTDGTYEALQARGGKRIDLMGMKEERRGASFARNRALPLMRGSIVLLLGDDMVPEDEHLLAGHLEAHRARPEPNYGVLGQSRWAEPVTPFMQWLETAGFQFSYDHIAAGSVDPAAFLYSSHASLKTETLRAAGGFDAERFPFLMEDTELGIRLKRQGFELEYRPDLAVRHHHPQTVRTFRRRMKVTGQAARRLREAYPNDAPAQVTVPSKGPLYAPAALAARLALAAGVRGHLRERAWGAIMMAAYARGWRRHR